MWRLLYNSLLILAAPAVVCILLAKPRCRRGFLQRLGFQRHSADQAHDPRPLIWIHAVSLGEVVAVAPLVKELSRRRPQYRYVVTTVTETGREAVEQRLAGVAEHRYAPLDFPWVVSGMVERLRPALYVFVETELWPNLLWALNARGIPAVLLNGRLSSRSFQRQDLTVMRSFYRSVLRSLTLCLMQSDRDTQRIVALGAEAARVHTTGNIKFDQPLPAKQADSSLRRSLGVGEQEPLFLAGSTHPGEEEQLVSAYAQLVKAHPSIVLMLAPRHIERVDRVEAMIREAGLMAQRKSQLGGVATGPRVIILDTRGELAQAYQVATVTFVGGTLVPVGGHNLLEPAVWGKPVLFGPHTDHCAEIASLLRQSGGGMRVGGPLDIVHYVGEWLTNPGACAAAGEAARQVVVQNQGALQRSLELIESCLTSSSVSVSQSVEHPAGSMMARP